MKSQAARNLVKMVLISMMSGCGNPPQWRPAHVYPVAMPGTPILAERSVPTSLGAVTAHTAVSTSEGYTYFVSHWDYAAVPKQPSRILDEVRLQAMQSAGQGDPSGVAVMPLTGLMGFELAAGSPAPELRLRAVLIGRRLYTFGIAVRDTDSLDQRVATAFLDSFKVPRP